MTSDAERMASVMDALAQVENPRDNPVANLMRRVCMEARLARDVAEADWRQKLGQAETDCRAQRRDALQRKRLQQNMRPYANIRKLYPKNAQRLWDEQDIRKFAHMLPDRMFRIDVRSFGYAFGFRAEVGFCGKHVFVAIPSDDFIDLNVHDSGNVFARAFNRQNHPDLLDKVKFSVITREGSLHKTWPILRNLRNPFATDLDSVFMETTGSVESNQNSSDEADASGGD